MTTPVLNRVKRDAQPGSTTNGAEWPAHLGEGGVAPEDLVSMLAEGLLRPTLGGGPFELTARSAERSPDEVARTAPPGNGNGDEAALEDGKRRLATVLGC